MLHFTRVALIDVLFFYFIRSSFASLLNFDLDISKKHDYLLNNHNVSVKSDPSVHGLTTFLISPPVELDKITDNGVAYLLDRSVLVGKLVIGLSVYWRDNTPHLLQLFSDEDITYLSHTGGLLNVESILTGFDINLKHHRPDRHVFVGLYLDLSKNRDYVDGNVTVKVERINRFPNEGFLYYHKYKYYTSTTFKLTGVVNGVGKGQVGLYNEDMLKEVYLYKWHEDNLVLELVKVDDTRLVYFRKGNVLWDLDTEVPEHTNPLYPYHILELLRSVNGYFNNEIIIDLAIKSDGTSHYDSNVKVNFGILNKISTQRVNVVCRMSNLGYGRYYCNFELPNKKPFKIRGVMNKSTFVVIKNPYDPIREFIVHFRGRYVNAQVVIFKTIKEYVYFGFKDRNWVHFFNTSNYSNEYVMQIIKKLEH